MDMLTTPRDDGILILLSFNEMGQHFIFQMLRTDTSFKHFLMDWQSFIKAMSTLLT
jgi:hypothetical protein